MSIGGSPIGDGSRHSASLMLPERLIEVMTRHSLGGVESMLLVHVILRPPEERLDDGTLVRLDPGSASEALGVCRAAVDAAANRLAARELLTTELLRGRRHVRLMRLDFEVGGLWPEPGAPGALERPKEAVHRILGWASRGRDAVFLLALLARTTAASGEVAVSMGEIASTLRITYRSAQRIAARLVRGGAIRRVRGGFDLSPLLQEVAGATPVPMSGRTEERGGVPREVRAGYEAALRAMRDEHP